MQIKVTQNEVIINKDILNDGEYNIHKCQFDFDEEYNGLVQKAVFSLNDGNSYLETIVNNECNIPIEVLEEGVLKIGVYAYETNNDELVLRYSPSPDIIHVFDGSYVKDAQNSEGGTPTEYEQLESRVNTALNEIDEALDNVETAVNEANNLDVDVSKTGKVATIDVTKKNGTVKTVTLSDGTSLQFKWEGTSLGIKTDNEESYTYVDLEGPQGKQGIQGPQGEEGKTGPQGETGATGNGILSIQKTATSGLVDTYTITFTDGTTTTFDVTNGEDGEVTQKQLDETNENVSWLQTLTEQMPHVAGQGTDLSLESVLNYRLMKFLPQGVSSQESTTGKNLLPLTNGTYTNAGIQAIINDGLISLSGTATSNSYITLLSNANIDIQNNITVVRNCSDTTLGDPELLVTINGTEYDIQNQSAHRDYRTLNAGTITRVRLRTASGKNMDGLTIRPMIYEGDYSTDIQYEPYTGGIPAPNTSYSIMPSRVTGENSLILQNENLFNKNSITPDSYLDSNGNIITNTTWSISDYIPVIAGEDYVYRWLTQVGNAPMSCYYDKNKNFVSSFKQTTYATKITIPTGVKYVRFTIEAKNTNDLNTFMFVKGSTTPTTYIANQTQTYQLSLGNIELNSSPDGTIRDGIVGKPNEWYKREYIGKVVLDGSETYTSMAWGSSGKYGYRTSINDLKIITSANEKANIQSNYFTLASANGLFALDVPNYGICARVNQSEIIIRNDDTTTVNDFKTWLSAHNTVVYYPLAEYTDIPITDTTLINQLNDIYNNAHSYNGVTNITTTYASGNEQMYLDIEALKNVWEVTE